MTVSRKQGRNPKRRLADDEAAAWIAHTLAWETTLARLRDARATSAPGRGDA